MHIKYLGVYIDKHLSWKLHHHHHYYTTGGYVSLQSWENHSCNIVNS